MSTQTMAPDFKAGDKHASATVFFMVSTHHISEIRTIWHTL